jgi:hypothetical protein
LDAGGLDGNDEPKLNADAKKKALVRREAVQGFGFPQPASLQARTFRVLDESHIALSSQDDAHQQPSRRTARNDLSVVFSVRQCWPYCAMCRWLESGTEKEFLRCD